MKNAFMKGPQTGQKFKSPLRGVTAGSLRVLWLLPTVLGHKRIRIIRKAYTGTVRENVDIVIVFYTFLNLKFSKLKLIF